MLYVKINKEVSWEARRLSRGREDFPLIASDLSVDVPIILCANAEEEQLSKDGLFVLGETLD